MNNDELNKHIEKSLKERGHSDPCKGIEKLDIYADDYNPADRAERLRKAREARIERTRARREREEERDMVIEEMAPGDLVDFGSYGRLYILKDLWGEEKFWVTSKRADRWEPSAAGWYIRKRFAKEIIERGDQYGYGTL